MLKWMLIIVGALVAAVAIIAIIGALMPRAHVASSSITLRQPPDTVWMVVRDFETAAEWWDRVETVERVAAADGREVWRQNTKMGPLPIAVESEDPPHRLVTRIDVPDDATFGGTWTYEIADVDGGSRLTITENGFVNNVVFRFLANTVFGLHGTMDSYLRGIAARFGEQVAPVHVRSGRGGDTHPS